MATAIARSELIQRTEELSELDQMKRDLISNITHEFKSPLALVENAVDVLMKDAIDNKGGREDMSEYLLMVRNNTGRLAQFIQDLLEVAKIEKAAVSLNLDRYNLIDVLKQSVELINPMAEKKNVRLSIQDSPKIPMTIDREKMHQVFGNLLSNAVKFTDEGEVKINVSVLEEKVQVRIADTGVGIDPKYLNSIFDRFFQVPDASKTKKKGTGLGLAIAKGWTEAHGGRLWAESAGPGKGTTFVVELPKTPVVHAA